MSPLSAYQNLERVFHKRGLIGDIAAILHWDQATMMPRHGGDGRQEQIALMEKSEHALLVSPQVKEWLEAAREEKLSPWQAANLREMERIHHQQQELPGDLVHALAKASGKCEMAWRYCRENDGSLSDIMTEFSDLLSLVQQTARARSSGRGSYDALLDLFDPGLTGATIEPLFSDLESFLPPMIDAIIARQARGNPPQKPRGPFSPTDQHALARRLMACMGDDFTDLRLDVAHHPFCGGAQDDIRITTRFNKQDFSENVMAIMHECGHAMYEMQLPKRWRYQPVGAARSMAFHESQSLIIEMQACRSRAFIHYCLDLFQSAFAHHDRHDRRWGMDNILALYRKVERSLIRVNADEVTYPLHIILRYRLEKAMIEGDLTISDLPAAWNDASLKTIGIAPDNDIEGCLQDVHWYSGAWGYFPSYSIGALMAAQLFAAARADDKDIEKELARGRFTKLREWLKKNLHAKASFYDGDTLILKASGAALGTDAFKSHLHRRYLEE